MSCAFARADNWEGKAKQIEVLEMGGELSLALAATTQLIWDLKQSDPKSTVLPAAIDRKASIEEELGQYRGAEHDYAEAISLWRSAGNETSVGLAMELNNMASLCSLMGQPKKAEGLRRESLELRLRLFGADKPEVAVSYSNLAVDLFRQERYPESAAYCHQAIGIWKKGAAIDDRSDLAFNTLALIELRNRNYSAALSFALEAVARCRSARNATLTRMASYEHTVALAREGTGQLGDSELAFTKAIDLVERSGQKPPSPIRVSLLTDYAHLLKQMRRTKEAKRLLHQAELERDALVRANQWQHTVDLKALMPTR